MDYAQIENNIVVNLVYLSSAYAYSDEYFINNHLVPINGAMIVIGDTYNEADGHFYRDGQRVYTQVEELNMALNILLLGEEYDV